MHVNSSKGFFIMSFTDLSKAIDRRLQNLQRVGQYKNAELYAQILILKHYQEQLKVVKEPENLQEKRRLTHVIKIKLDTLGKLLIPSLIPTDNELLQLAINQESNSELLQAFIASKPGLESEPFIMDKVNKTALSSASAAKRADLVDLLLRTYSYTIEELKLALSHAILVKDLKTISILLKAGATPTQAHLESACVNGSLDIVEILVRENNKAEPFDYNQALRNTVLKGPLALVKPVLNYLIDVQNADVNHKEQNLIDQHKPEFTPLVWAIKHEKYDTAQFLKEKGANVEYAKEFFDWPQLPKYLSDTSVKAVSLDTRPRQKEEVRLPKKSSAKKNDLPGLLREYLDERESHKDKNGEVKKYLNLHLPFFGCIQKSYGDKKASVEEVQRALKALNGELVDKPIDLHSHLSTLRNRTLGNTIRDFVKAGHADSIVGSKVTTVREFISALEDKANEKIIREDCSL